MKRLASRLSLARQSSRPPREPIEPIYDEVFYQGVAALDADGGDELPHSFDPPSLDGTDGAHPAWWRGSDAGVLGAVRVIEQALAGTVEGACQEPLQHTRTRVAALRRLATEQAGLLHRSMKTLEGVLHYGLHGMAAHADVLTLCIEIQSLLTRLKELDKASPAP